MQFPPNQYKKLIKYVVLINNYVYYLYSYVVNMCKYCICILYCIGLFLMYITMQKSIKTDRYLRSQQYNPNRKMLNITRMPSLIQSNSNQGFPVILAYYFINAIVWISDFKPLHLEGDVAVHKYYCTWNSTTQKLCNPNYIICTLNF